MATRRSLLAGAGTAATLGLAGCSGLLASGDGGRNGSPTPEDVTGSPTRTPAETSGPAASIDGPVASMAVSRTDADYAHLGAADAPTATLYCGWKCPYTETFVTEMLPAVVREYVAPGDLAIEFRAVRFLAGDPHGEDEPRANRAGLAVWHSAPERFPAYVAALFADQPPETEEWATRERLLSYARRAGIEETDPIARAIEGEEYDDLWRESQALVEQKGLEGIPRLELGGEITAPTIDPRSTERQLRTTLE